MQSVVMRFGQFHFAVAIFLSHPKIIIALWETCSTDPLFSTKTPYKMVANTDLHVERPRNCTPIQINMVFRHGHRYPSAKDVKRMNRMAIKINQAVSSLSTDVNLTLPWKNPFSVRLDKALNIVGEGELYELGKRIRTRFPEVFTQQYSSVDYKFQSSCKLRATQSASALGLGLFEGLGSHGISKVQPIALEILPCDNDPILRFFDLCKKYVLDVLRQKHRFVEVSEFFVEAEMMQVMKKIASRLGIKDLELTRNDLTALFVGCAYEVGMFNGSYKSGLCALFDEDDLNIMEYALDLKNYYKRSSGYRITYESSCPLLRDVMHSLKDLVRENISGSAYSAVFRASHAETIIPYLALLGVFVDDQPLRSENYQDMKHRKFRAGCLAPFSGNSYFVLYKCSEGHKIQLYVNERLVRIPGCDSEIDCDFRQFENHYRNIVEKCDFDVMCSIDKEEL